MDHSPKGCGVIRHNQTEVLPPNATVYVKGGRVDLGHGSDDPKKRGHLTLIPFALRDTLHECRERPADISGYL